MIIILKNGREIACDVIQFRICYDNTLRICPKMIDGNTTITVRDCLFISADDVVGIVDSNYTNKWPTNYIFSKGWLQK
jgi:hypothetical protein